MKLLYIEWFDAYASDSNGGWQSADEAVAEAIAKTDDLCVSVGILLHEDDVRVVIANSRSYKQSADFDVDGVICISKGMIRVRREVTIK